MLQMILQMIFDELRIQTTLESDLLALGMRRQTINGIVLSSKEASMTSSTIFLAYFETNINSLQ